MQSNFKSPVLAQLEKTINDGLEAGDSLADISRAASEVYGAADDYSAEWIAKTEAFRTSNMALKEKWAQFGVVKTVRWYNADNPCPFCQETNGKIISVDSNFLDEDQTVSACEGDNAQTYTADYGDIGGPPLRRNCVFSCVLMKCPSNRRN
jgi:hypothetical protein